jgi:hypothetical protein
MEGRTPLEGAGPQVEDCAKTRDGRRVVTPRMEAAVDLIAKRLNLSAQRRRFSWTQGGRVSKSSCGDGRLRERSEARSMVLKDRWVSKLASEVNLPKKVGSNERVLTLEVVVMISSKDQEIYPPSARRS